MVDLGNIALKAGEELNAVSVVAYKPLVTQELDRIKYDVEADPDSKNSSTHEMLRKVPLVTLDHDEDIEVKGKTSFEIHINGKPSKIVSKNPKDALKSIPASSVKRIEIITEPGAKYDAEGVDAIINIVTQSALQVNYGQCICRLHIYHKQPIYRNLPLCKNRQGWHNHQLSLLLGSLGVDSRVAYNL